MSHEARIASFIIRCKAKAITLFFVASPCAKAVVLALGGADAILSLGAASMTECLFARFRNSFKVLLKSSFLEGSGILLLRFNFKCFVPEEEAERTGHGAGERGLSASFSVY